MNFSADLLFASLIISTIGFALFRYGKKQERMPQLICGIILMAFPYFVESTLWMTAVAGSLIAGLWFAIRNGL